MVQLYEQLIFPRLTNLGVLMWTNTYHILLLCIKAIPCCQTHLSIVGAQTRTIVTLGDLTGAVSFSQWEKASWHSCHLIQGSLYHSYQLPNFLWVGGRLLGSHQLTEVLQMVQGVTDIIVDCCGCLGMCQGLSVFLYK